MTSVSRFDAYGAWFVFEPPVEMGDYPADSLSRVAAVATVGPQVSPEGIASMERIAHSTLEGAHDIAHGDPALIARALNKLLEGKHIVYWE